MKSIFLNIPFAIVLLLLGVLGVAIVAPTTFHQATSFQAQEQTQNSLPSVTVGAQDQQPDEAVRKIPQIWTSTSRLTAYENAENHFRKHNRDFKFKTVDDYIAAATKFLHYPPRGVQTVTQADGDVVRYLDRTGEFAVMRADGTPRTYYILNPDIHGYPTNQAYFDAQSDPR